DIRLDAAHADDVGAAVDHRLVEARRVGERLDPALLQLALEVALILLAVDRGELEAQAFLAGDPACDPHQPLALLVVAAAAGRAHQYRYSGSPPGEQHQPQVALVRGIGKLPLARSQMVRPGIRRA